MLLQNGRSRFFSFERLMERNSSVFWKHCAALKMSENMFWRPKLASYKAFLRLGCGERDREEWESEWERERASERERDKGQNLMMRRQHPTFQLPLTRHAARNHETLVFLIFCRDSKTRHSGLRRKQKSSPPYFYFWLKNNNDTEITK